MSDEGLRERIARLRGRLVGSSVVASFEVISESVVRGIGLHRIRALLVNGDDLYLLERFEWIDEKVQIGKYSFHWQRADGSLIRRWDNAPHHREIATFPHHLHEGGEDNVLPHRAVDCFMVLRMIENELAGTVGISPPGGIGR